MSNIDRDHAFLLIQGPEIRTRRGSRRLVIYGYTLSENGWHSAVLSNRELEQEGFRFTWDGEGLPRVWAPDGRELPVGDERS